jgi:hypothetical protein
MSEQTPHTLYTTEDFAEEYNGEPYYGNPMLDRNGEVVLALCKVCGQAEGELQTYCPGPNWRKQERVDEIF